MFGKRVKGFGFAGLLAVFATPVGGDAPLPGPVPAEVVRVIDGDTIEVRARIWVGQEVKVGVRLLGIDAPEIFRPACRAERRLGDAARDAVEAQAVGQVGLKQIERGKYAGRVIADVVLADGRSLSAALLDSGHAVAYGTEASWCPRADRRAPTTRTDRVDHARRAASRALTAMASRGVMPGYPSIAVVSWKYFQDRAHFTPLARWKMTPTPSTSSSVNPPAGTAP